MSSHASGPFDVKRITQPSDHPELPLLGRFLLDKVFHGDLEGTSKGQMLATGTATGGIGRLRRHRVGRGRTARPPGNFCAAAQWHHDAGGR